MSKLFQIIFSLLVVYIPLTVFAQDPVWFNTVLGYISGVLPRIISILVGIALLVFFIGLARFILKAGDESAVTEGKQYMIWGVIGMAVLISVWGFVALLQQMVGVNTTATVPAPQVQNPI